MARDTRKIYRKRGRLYADFRPFAADGGRKQALIAPDADSATADRRVADELYDRRLAELLALRAARLGPAAETANGRITLELVLAQFTDARSSFVDPSVTRDRRRYQEIVFQTLDKGTLATAVDTGMLEDFVEALKHTDRGDGAPYAESYQGKIIRFLSNALAWARIRRYIDHNPAADLDPITLPNAEPEEETNFFTVEEGGILLSALQRNADGSIPAEWPMSTPYYVFEQVAFALLTGARRNEMQAQRWEWIDWDASLVRLMTSKRRRGRMRDRPDRILMRAVPLWSQLREILLAYWHHEGEPAEGLLFPKSRESSRRKHTTRIERGGRADKSIRTILRAKKVITGPEDGPPLFKGQPGYHFSWREFRVSYCAARLQCVEPVAGVKNAWAAVAQRTVEIEMGHNSAEMVEQVYGRVKEGPQLRLTTLAYPIKRAKTATLKLHQA